jgi:mannose-6-phosphate isomerase-like protein (cupin superfamily)
VNTVHSQALTTDGSLLRPPVSERLKSGFVILKPGESIGAHRTDEREEMLIILAGTALVECEDKMLETSDQTIVYIPRNMLHNVTNPSSEVDLKYIYVVSWLGS